MKATLGARETTTRQATPPRPPAMTRKQIAGLAVAVGALVLVAGTQTESAFIKAVGATNHQLEWISDVIAAVAVTSLTYLWLHLRATRAELLNSERARIIQDEQFRMAAEIQRTLLPEIPSATRGYRWAARMETAHQVGGDFYDFVTTGEGSVLLILGDVSGKGMPAAMMQSSLTTLFRVHASMTADPDAIAARMSQALFDQTGGNPYATAIVARFDHSPHRVTYVNAGHPAGLVVRRSGVLRLESGGPPLGLLPGAGYDGASFDLAPGDAGVLVTDGVTEALEGIPLLLSQALDIGHRPPSATPREDCDYLLGLAADSPGPLGSEAWSDDRTALAFRVSN
jgi:sigma-B regulation protein RsbU (phosphoserine phosphatase)